ncbi:CDP-alcohol phosphatidyltransferase family protein [Tsuneonella troitsensis]|uniref:CDP-alcohol phosphatidyltransferase family protein n=1 Tax=Tsuneonella troitsensis TaxID=292222 RepID=UPI00070B6470|nr:phosphatidylcholine/phosphatidylserine synthase [Tsuneonella troitsensis]
MSEERPRIGPKAAEDEVPLTPRGSGPRGLAMRAVVPNAITAAAMCSGLTGIRFAMSERWEEAVFAVILAGVLDAMDGRVARLLKAQSRFGAELDSLADSLSFGTAPALILFLWSLDDVTRFGWFAALAFAICGALRLARFNAQIDVSEQPHKSAGFLTGVPAPVGAGLAFLPIYIWLATGDETFRDPRLVAPWTGLVAFLMISNLATLSWGKMRPRPDVRLGLIALVGMVFAALLLEPWWTLTGICLVYLATVPWSIARYARIRRQRASVPAT